MINNIFFPLKSSLIVAYVLSVYRINAYLLMLIETRKTYPLARYELNDTETEIVEQEPILLCQTVTHGIIRLVYLVGDVFFFICMFPVNNLVYVSIGIAKILYVTFNEKKKEKGPAFFLRVCVYLSSFIYTTLRHTASKIIAR